MTSGKAIFDKVSDDQFRDIMRSSFTFEKAAKKMGMKTARSAGCIQRFKKRAFELNIDISHFKVWKTPCRPEKMKKIPDDQFRDIMRSSISFEEAAKKLGLKTARGGQISAIKKRAIELNIDLNHVNFNKKRKRDLELKTSRSKVVNRRQLKLVNRPYICENCNCVDMIMGDNGEWQWKGHDLPLEINHRFGHGFEGCHHPANLQWLCSSCHRQHTNLFMSAKRGLRDRFNSRSPVETSKTK